MDFTVPECDGRCCAVFTLNAGALDAMETGAVPDSGFILAMLVPLTPEEALARGERYGLTWPEAPADYQPDRDEAGDVRRFTCRHRDEDSRRCRAYGQRPHICTHFPAGKCGHCGGTLRIIGGPLAEELPVG